MKKRFIKSISICIAVASVFSLCSCGNTLKTKKAQKELTQTEVILKSKSRENEDFDYFFSIFSESFTSAGLLEGSVPQGLSYSQTLGLFITSAYYPDSEFASVLSTYDENGEFLAYYPLKNNDGTDYFGHAGGICCSDTTLFVTGEGECRTLPLEALKAKSGEAVSFEANFKLQSNGSFACCDENNLYIGDFVENNEDATDITTLKSGETFYALCYAYSLIDGLPDINAVTEDATGYVPSFALTIPTKAQGMAITPSGDIIFSTSYGRRNNSKLYVYSSPFDADKSATVEVDGVKVDVYACTSKLLDKEITALPMSEGVVCVGNKVYLLFESGAAKYRQHRGKFPTDKVFVGEFE